MVLTPSHQTRPNSPSTSNSRSRLEGEFTAKLNYYFTENWLYNNRFSVSQQSVSLGGRKEWGSEENNTPKSCK